MQVEKEGLFELAIGLSALLITDMNWQGYLPWQFMSTGCTHGLVLEIRSVHSFAFASW